MFLSSVNNDFFCYRCGLSNLLNQSMFIVRVTRTIKLNIKKPSWEIRVMCKCLCGEWAAVRE